VARFSKTPDFDISSGLGLSIEEYESQMIDKKRDTNTYGSIIVTKFRGF
jgi:hypothetical protein